MNDYDEIKEETDINVKERIYNKYNKISSNKNLEIIIVCIVFFFIVLYIMINNIINIKGYEIYLLIPFALFLLAIGGLVLALVRNRKIKNFDYENKKLCYYTGEIKEIYREKIRRYVYRYYLEFGVDKKIIISYATYKNIINNNIQKVKVYFYNELLEDARYLEKYIVEELE